MGLLLQGGGATVGRIEGLATLDPHRIRAGPHGFARLDLGSGQAELLPGAPLGDGAFMDFVPNPGASTDQDFDVIVRGPGPGALDLPLHVRVTPGLASQPRSLPAEVASSLQVAFDHGIGVLVRLSPTHPEDARWYGGGRWLLEVRDDGGPLIWERLPDPGIPDETQERHLSVGPDGSVYLMVAGKEGMTIYRR